jgi:hypothetical protein
MWRIRLARCMQVGLIVALMIGLCAAHGAVAAGGSRDASATSILPATKVTVFHPTGAAGATVRGNCAMGGSLAVQRADAWRCIVGNEIYDPCFSAGAHATSVICGATPAKPVGIRVSLPGPLPAHDRVLGSQAWILQLGNGTTCGFLTGGTFGIKGQRANYGCSNSRRDYVVGTPTRGRVWYAVIAVLSAKPSPNGPTAERIYAVSVAKAWM